VNVLHVLPPLVFFAIGGEELMQALLSHVLLKDVDPFNIGAFVVHGTIAAIREALLLLEIGIAASACPSHDARCEGYVPFTHRSHEFLVRLAEVAYKV